MTITERTAAIRAAMVGVTPGPWIVSANPQKWVDTDTRSHVQSPSRITLEKGSKTCAFFKCY
jgi:hypothetical protein